VLLGGSDFWSNGIHLNVIEASADPAQESWLNINAIDDLKLEMLNTMSHVVIAACEETPERAAPRRVGQAAALELTQACQPLGAQAAREIGFIDDAFGEDSKSFETELRERATRIAQDPEFRAMLRRKHEARLDAEHATPLASYRAAEFDRMKINFFGFDAAYHEARRRFVFKGNPPPRESSAPILEQIKAGLMATFSPASWRYRRLQSQRR